MKIKAPFTDEQISNIKHHQLGAFHPFTCPNKEAHEIGSLVHNIGGYPGSKTHLSGILYPITTGMICTECDYTQDWVHDFMANTYKNPFENMMRKLKIKNIIDKI